MSVSWNLGSDDYLATWDSHFNHLVTTPLQGSRLALSSASPCVLPSSVATMATSTATAVARAATSSPRPLPLAAGVPPHFQRHMGALESATEQCGRMSESVARLVEVVGFFERFVDRNDEDRSGDAEGVVTLVQEIRQASTEELAEIDAAMQMEFDRSKKEFEEDQARCQAEFQAMQVRTSVLNSQKLSANSKLRVK
ncbi:hypothetical protein CF326_g7800 [Tilletia indica]|nr:hypothetical protein CF326_g7800 [Tilletia indica]